MFTNVEKCNNLYFQVPGDTPVSETKQGVDSDTLEKSELDVKIDSEALVTTPRKENTTSIPIPIDTAETDDKILAGHFSPIHTATVQECSEMDTVSIISTEKVVPAVATEVTLTEDDVGMH